MSAPDPEGFSLLSKALAASVAIGTPILGFLKLWNTKADKHAVASQFQDVKNELAIQRSHIGKLFDKFGESESKNEERHRELLMHLIQRKE